MGNGQPIAGSMIEVSGSWSIILAILTLEAPLYGRGTAQLDLQPMGFASARRFVPRYSLPAALTTYAIAGRIPAYLERFDDSRSVEANVRVRVLAPTTVSVLGADTGGAGKPALSPYRRGQLLGPAHTGGRGSGEYT